MAYIGNTPTQQAFAPAIDYFSGNGSTVAFTLSRPVASVAQVQVVVNNVPQNPSTAFTVSGQTLTFTGAPSSGTNNIYVEYTSPITQVVQPGQGTVGTTQLVDGSITTAKLASSFIAPEANGGTGTTTGYYGFKNRIINGAMVIDQRNAGASVTVNNSNNNYITDRFVCQGQSTDGVFTAQQVSDAPSGFTNSLKIQVTTADASIGSTQYYFLQQRIEGYNVADLGFGAVGASTVTLSFWAKSSVTGTFGGSLSNDAVDRSYPFTYTINSANTWEYKTVTVAGDTTGTWLKTNGLGLRVYWNIGAGSSYTASAGAWVGQWAFNATGANNLIATVNATLQVTGVQLEKGSTATSFDYRPYGTELALCQRYYVKRGVGGLYSLPTGGGYLTVFYKVPMRTAPTLTITADFGQATVPTNPDGTNMFGVIYQASSPIGFSADQSAEL